MQWRPDHTDGWKGFSTGFDMSSKYVIIDWRAWVQRLPHPACRAGEWTHADVSAGRCCWERHDL